MILKRQHFVYQEKMFFKSLLCHVLQTVVWRRYNDFKKLYKAMSYLHRALQRKEEFPPFAEGKMFGKSVVCVVIYGQEL